jgi:hypothetical protein
MQGYPNSNTLVADRSHPDHLVACVIAQHYISAPFISLHVHSHKEKFGVRFKNISFFFLLLLL